MMGWLTDVERMVDATFAAPTGGVNKPHCKHRTCVHAVCCDCGLLRVTVDESSHFEQWAASLFAALIFAAVVYLLLTHAGEVWR